MPPAPSQDGGDVIGAQGVQGPVQQDLQPKGSSSIIRCVNLWGGVQVPIHQDLQPTGSSSAIYLWEGVQGPGQQDLKPADIVYYGDVQLMDGSPGPDHQNLQPAWQVQLSDIFYLWDNPMKCFNLQVKFNYQMFNFWVEVHGQILQDLQPAGQVPQ